MGTIQTIRTTEYWQRALANSVRVEVCIKELGIDPRVEFDRNDHRDTKYVLAVDGNLPVGTCRLNLLSDEHVAKIERVNVIRDYRGSGVGRKLIEEAEMWAYDEGYKDILITSREEAIPFYEKIGYTAYPNEKFQSSVYVCVPMKKVLNKGES